MLLSRFVKCSAHCEPFGAVISLEKCLLEGVNSLEKLLLEDVILLGKLMCFYLRM